MRTVAVARSPESGLADPVPLAGKSRRRPPFNLHVALGRQRDDWAFARAYHREVSHRLSYIASCGTRKTVGVFYQSTRSAVLHFRR